MSSFGEKVEGVKDHKYLGLKGLYRKGKQATMEKFGKSVRVAEDPSFRGCVDRTNQLKSSYKTMADSVGAIAGAVEGFNINFRALSESFEAFSKILTECDLSRSLLDLVPGFKEACEYCKAFSENARKNVVPVFDRLSTVAVADLEKTKKTYNGVRYEHDEVKHSLDKAMGKPLKGSNQEKVNRLQKDYNDLHTRYLELQAEYMARSVYLEAVVQRDAGIALMSLSKELINWSGQIYRILSSKAALIESTSATLSSLPVPEYVPPKKDESASGSAAATAAANTSSAPSSATASAQPSEPLTYPSVNVPSPSAPSTGITNDANPTNGTAGGQ